MNLDELEIATNSASLQNLSIFCLALGLSTNVGRWWSMNENGVSPIMNSNNKIAIRMRLGWDAMMKSERYHDNPEYQLKMIRHILNIERHFEGATLLGADTSDAVPAEAGEVLAEHLAEMMQQTDMPNGVGGVGFDGSDIDELVAGAMGQQRLLSVSPREVQKEGLH